MSRRGGLSTIRDALLLEPSTLPRGGYSLSKSIYDSRTSTRPTRVRRASQVPQGRVPRGVHGEAR